MINFHERMLPTRRGSNQRPTDHQSYEHPTEPTRMAQETFKTDLVVIIKSLRFIQQFEHTSTDSKVDLFKFLNKY